MTDRVRKCRDAWRKTNKLKGLAVIVWALFLIAGLAMVDDYGVSVDAEGQRRVAINTLNYVLHSDQTLLQDHDRFYGAAFEAPLLLLTERVLGLEDSRHVYLARHALTHLFFLIGGFCCYLLALRLSGNRLIALLVMLLFLLSPRLYAHSFFNSKDAVFASAFVMALLFASRAFDKDSVGAYRQCGIVAGLLLNLRIMGVVLFAIVLVFRAWAWFRAAGRERRRATATTGVFALWGGVVLFISLPYLWGDPAGRLAEMLAALSDHPTVYQQLFRGQVFSAAALPWDYALHWFAISQPPATLLLGLLGLGAVWGGVRRGAGGGGELRFGNLLAACFALPLVAFVLLRPTTYNDWRHFYFLHGPFCLLATFALMGARQLPVRGLRKKWLGGAASALTAAGLGAAAVEMAQIHPNQHLYFNFLADRKTPEGLRARYEMDYLKIALPQSYKYLLRQTPAGAINIGKRHFDTRREWDTRILPAADRRRFTLDPNRDLDFLLSNGLGVWWSHRPNDTFPPVLHRIKVYNNTIIAVSTPDLSRVDPAVADEYRALHRTATSGAPVARGGGFEVYRHGQRLAWVKEACKPGELFLPFWLAFYPVDASRASPHQQRMSNDAKLVYGVRFDGKCLGAARLPDFALSRIHLSQGWGGGGGTWEIEAPL